MQKNKKVLVGLAVLGIVFLVPSTTQASSSYNNWKTYFSFEEMNSLRKKTTDTVKDNFKNNADWKDIIGGKNIKNDSITSEKIKDGSIATVDVAAKAVTGAKIADATITSANVDSTITKKKIYTGTMPTSKTGADKVVVDDTDSDYTYNDYYKQISAPEVTTSNMPNIVVWKKPLSEPEKTSFSGAWEEFSGFYVEDGKIWVDYMDIEDDKLGNPDSLTSTTHVDSYKIVVNY